jgi:membrane protein
MTEDQKTQPGRLARWRDTGWWRVLWRTKKAISDDNVGLVAAGVAFYGLLAIFPGLAALVSLYGLVADPVQVQEQLEAASGILPDGAMDLLREQLTQVSASAAGALSLAAAGGLVIALWGTARITKAFMQAMNIAYGEQEKRGFLRINLTAITLTAGILLTAATAIGAVVVVPVVLDLVGLGDAAEWLISILRWPMVAVVFLGALAVLYNLGPSRRRPPWRWVTPGSLVALAFWLGASILFSFYVSNFGSYNETYGSLGAVIGMMMWLWLSAFAILIGAEVNAETGR